MIPGSLPDLPPSFIASGLDPYHVIVQPYSGNDQCPSRVVTFKVAPDIHCYCASWDSIYVFSDKGKKYQLNCGGELDHIQLGSTLNIEPTINCESENNTCIEEFEWTIQLDGQVISSGDIIPIRFSPTQVGKYTLTIDGYCGSNRCTYSCNISINVEKIENNYCQCVDWQRLTAKINNHEIDFINGESFNTLSINSDIIISGNYQCNGNNCNVAYRWSITGPSYSKFGRQMPVKFTPTNRGEYTGTITSYCNGRKCRDYKFTFNVGK